jgi:VWFA-related protein
MNHVRAVVSLLALPILLSAHQAPQPPDQIPTGPVFSSRIAVVQVDALVTENNRPVSGLQASDFEVQDNGIRQDVQLIAGGSVPLNVVLALDTSGSVDGDRLVQLRAAANALLDGLRPEDRAGLVTFNRTVLNGSALTMDVGAIRTALATSVASGETSLRNGVFAGLAIGQTGAGRALLIVLSDGIDTASWLPAKDVLDIARRTDVVVYGISTAQARKVPFLDEVSAVTGGKLFQGEWSERLSDTFLAVLDEFRHRYVLTFSPHGVERGGWHRLTVKVKGRNLKINARAGYMSR